MQLGIFAKTFPGGDPLSVLAQARDAGYACVQFNMACAGLPSLPRQIDDAAIDRIVSASSQTGVKIAALSGTYNMIHPDASVRRDGLQRLCAIIAAAPRMGTRLVTLCTGTRDPDDQWRHHPENEDSSAWRDLILSMKQALVLAETHGVDLAIEPELANVVSTPERARQLIDALASPRLVVVLDPANLFECASRQDPKSIIASAVDLLGDRIAIAHAKDRGLDGSFAAAGKGVVDFRDFISQLKHVGFDGPLVTHGLASDEAGEVARYLSGILQGGEGAES
ncbi:sugar phosphate isomerase/epimerase [Mesorhizobium sp. LNJC405B00]|uniref:sugar phosphate isomerase/epimerase family protein n=1 Tax=Mesorhizobium sp. LNJC405B00 TaxID=1287281 RepID=UPI0003CE8E21|nr:sugar phosphate isomerase/epimerase [Mesorhizobium sp. LNJC405B00]ESY01356.1 epimerase [Mesorhizobium sp. LNJC405B00]